MSPSQIAALANKVTEKKNELREKMIRTKCYQLGIARGRLVLAKEITLTAKEKEANMQEAFDTVLREFPFDERAALKREIGKELNRRKQDRKLKNQALLVFQEKSTLGLFAQNASAIKDALDLIIEDCIRAGKLELTQEGDLQFLH